MLEEMLARTDVGKCMSTSSFSLKHTLWSLLQLTAEYSTQSRPTCSIVIIIINWLIQSQWLQAGLLLPLKQMPKEIFSSDERRLHPIMNPYFLAHIEILKTATCYWCTCCSPEQLTHKHTHTIVAGCFLSYFLMS